MSTVKRTANMKSMRGVTVIGILIMAIIVIFVAVIAMNMVPSYMQHLEVKDILNDLAKDPATNQSTKAKIRELFSRRLQVNSIGSSVIKPESLEIEKKDGKTLMSLKYEVRTHLFANVDVVIQFDDQVQTE